MGTLYSPYKGILYQVGIIVACFLTPVLCCNPLEAREGSASLAFQKTADPRKTMVYVVKKGDSLAGIFRKQRGDERVPYRLIRQLNPKIRHLNLIYPGQKIVLPVRETLDPSGLSSDTRNEKEPPFPDYRIKEEDSVSRLTEHAPTATVMKTQPTVEHILGYIRPVVNRMMGTVIVQGNYFIPLKESAQITIDCSLIPAVELDDGVTVFLDFGNRLSEAIKDLIGQSWTNYVFLPGKELADGLTGLKGIIGRSRNYTMTEVVSPLSLISKPEIQVFPDWMITAEKTAAGMPYRQGLFLLKSNEKPLPEEARSCLEKNGLSVTEISGEREVAGPLWQKSSPTVIDMRGLKGIALAEKLVKMFGERPVTNAEVVIFDQARNGFNLSLNADLLLRKGEKQIIIHTKRLPEQFVRILSDEGTEVIPIGEKESGRPLIEGIIQGLRIPISFGHFSFRIPEGRDHPRITVTFPALRTTYGGDTLYLIDFDMSPVVLTLLQGVLGGQVAIY